MIPTILKSNDNELIKRIYKAQTENPSPGDFIELVKNDYEMIQEEFNENKILNMSKESFKQFIKEKIKTAAFNYLRKLQSFRKFT